MKRLLLVFVLLATSFLHAATVFVAQVTAGTADGSSCANAKIWSTTINASDVIHLCGTINGSGPGTTAFTPPTGTSANPTKIIFETGATLSQTYWGSTGAIYLNGVSWVTIDGSPTSTACGIATGSPGPNTAQVSCNGLIQNTANGTALANQQGNSRGIVVAGSNHIEIRNLQIANIYQNGGSSAAASDIAGATCQGISLTGNDSNILIHNDWINGASRTILYDFSGATTDTIQIYNNVLQDADHHIDINGTGGILATNYLIHDNDISGWWNWQCPASAAFCNTKTDSYHTDGMIIGVSQGNLFQPKVYGNYIHGDLGQGSPTAFIYCTVSNPAIAGNTSTACKIFNNLLVMVKDASRTTSNGPWMVSTGTHTGSHEIYNNTLIGWNDTPTKESVYAMNLSGTNLKVKNNFVENARFAIGSYELTQQTPFANPADVNDNYYFNINGGTTQFAYNVGNGFFTTTWATWNTTDGYDASTSGINVDPGTLTSGYAPQVGSALIAAGVNLLGDPSADINSDLNAVGRPTVAAWDVGAQQYVAAGTQLLTILGAGNANGKVCTDGATCADGIINAVSTASVISGTGTHSFTAGATATLTATATSGSFVTFSGGGCTTSPCTVTMNSPLTVTATFQTPVSCSLTFAANSIDAASQAAPTTTFTGVSGPNSLWFIFGPPPANLPVYNCQYPYVGCNANGQAGNIIPAGAGIYTAGACSNGVCCTGSTAPLNIWTPVGRSAR